MQERFRLFAAHIAKLAGSPGAFMAAVAVVVIWGLTGPAFHFSDTWQLVINTGTTIVTFLMVFLIQNSQNRDAKAVHLKLDELIRGVKGARNELLDCEDLTEEEIEKLQEEFRQLRYARYPRKTHRAAANAGGHSHGHAGNHAREHGAGRGARNADRGGKSG